MISGRTIIVCKARFAIIKIVVLLNIKEIIILNIMVIISVDLTLDYKCHVTERETNVIFEEKPGVILTVTSMTIMKPKLQSFIFFDTDVNLFIDLSYVKAG